MNQIQAARIDIMFYYWETLSKVLCNNEDNWKDLTIEDVVILAMKECKGRCDPHIFRGLLESL